MIRRQTIRVDETRRARTYVMAHVYSADGVKRLVRLGVRSIEHGNLVDDEAVRLMKEAGACLVPNLIAYEVVKPFGREHGFPESGLARMQIILDAGARSVELAEHYGVKVGYGSDLVKAPDYQSDEFTELVESTVFCELGARSGIPYEAAAGNRHGS